MCTPKTQCRETAKRATFPAEVISSSQSDGEGLLMNKAEIVDPQGEETSLKVSAHIFKTENMPLI